MFNFLLDETGLYIVLTIIAIAVAVIVPTVLHLRQRQKKTLSYEILSSTNLFGHVKEDLKRNLKISYKDKPVEQLHLIVVRILNSGNIQIIPTDYERPISFTFGKEARILTAEIVKTYPEHANLRPSLVTDEEKAVLEKTTLNSGDSIILKILVSKFGKLEIDGRIAGVKEIQELHESNRTYLGVGIASTALIVAYGFLQSYSILNHDFSFGFWNISLIVASFVVLLGGFAIISYQNRTEEKSRHY